ncbi:hypothetical protein BGZ96_008621 [Linnemannia gamsii]|uniref:Uncharacterized protein n=1 Tax=Linnemannia gamsii TaxID=64522 RepID=A0ABQ7KDS0_9FUNG|nr:hypothetical protein BGZ96_008621 [Linnemannia gamsii]
MSSKKAGVAIQEAGLREAIAGVKRYPSELPNDETLEVIEDPESEPESGPEVGSSAVALKIAGHATPSSSATLATTTASASILSTTGTARSPRRATKAQVDGLDVGPSWTSPTAPPSPSDISLDKDATVLSDVTPSGGSSHNGSQHEDDVATQVLLGVDLLSSDPVDVSFDFEDPSPSPTMVYAWNFLEGNGRIDSHVDNPWIHNGVNIGHDLMDFRRRVVEDNGGLADPHEKLAVNFVFLIEMECQTRGLQAEIEDESWDALCEVTKDAMHLLPDGTVAEAHRWAHLLAHAKPDIFKASLRESPPMDPTLNTILHKITSDGWVWSDHPCNEDTYLKFQLGPFLDVYMDMRFTVNAWTLTQEDTRNTDTDRLVPDFTMVTMANKRQLSLLLMEGKVKSNKCFQIWDDRTKLGQEMKLSLDSILMLQPEDDVWVIGILVRVEFFTMHIHAEAMYVMRRFAVCYAMAGCMNMFAIGHMMEAFQHAQTKVEKTVEAIRRVKVRPSSHPKVPLTWLRPSFKKPKLSLVIDGE